MTLPLMCYQTLGLPEALGFYREEGVEVESFGVEGGTAALQALVAGKGDVVSTTPASMAALLTQGMDPNSKIVYVCGASPPRLGFTRWLPRQSQPTYPCTGRHRVPLGGRPQS